MFQAVLGAGGNPHLMRVRPCGAQQDVCTPCPRSRGPEGQHTHQLDALGKGVVLPVLLREPLQDLALAIPAACGDKSGSAGAAPAAPQPRRAGTSPRHRVTSTDTAAQSDPGPFRRHGWMAALLAPAGKVAISIVMSKQLANPLSRGASEAKQKCS